MELQGTSKAIRRRWAAAAMAVALMAGLLSACGGDDGGTPTLNWYINPDNGGQDNLAKICTEASGGKYRIKTSLLPRDATAQREQLVRRLAASDSTLDIMSLDPPFVAEFANAKFLYRFPDDRKQRLTEGRFEAAVKSGTWQGGLYAAPFWSNTQLLWYRKDVARKAGLDMEKPVTWEELTKAADETGTKLDIQGKKAENYSVFINALVETAGGHVVTDVSKGKDLKVTVDSEAGRRAAKVIRDIARSKAANAQLSVADEDIGLNEFMGDNGGFIANWPYTWQQISGGDDKKLERNLGWARWPRVVADKPSKPPYGGINLAVGAHSSNTRLAAQAVECLTSRDNSIYYFVGNGKKEDKKGPDGATRPGYEGSGNPSDFQDAYDEAAVKKAFPMAGLIRESIEAAAPRPVSPVYPDVSGALVQKFHPPGAVSEKTPKAAATFIRDVLDDKAVL